MSRNPWTRERLQQFVGQEESYNLEFKSSRPLLDPSGGKVDSFFNDLSCHVSAFLNSDGGLLIIGLEEPPQSDRKRAELAIGLSDGVPRSVFTASRLSNKLCDRVHPAIGSYLQVYPVPVGKTGDGEDLLAFVVNVQPGITAYQAADKRYYCRRSFSIEPMEDKDVRLRMLTDTRPRAALKIEEISGEPAFVSWEHLESDLSRFAQKRCVFLAKYPDFQDTATHDKEYAESFMEVVTAKPAPVERWGLTLKLALINTGHITIRRGAMGLGFEGDDQSAFEIKADMVQLSFEEKSPTPLYPEMAVELPPIRIMCPRGVDVDADSGILSVTVYLDGGAPVRLQIPLADRLRDVLKSSEEKLESLLRPGGRATDSADGDAIGAMPAGGSPGGPGQADTHRGADG